MSKGPPSFLVRKKKREWISKRAVLELLRVNSCYKKNQKKVIEDTILKVYANTNARKDITRKPMEEQICESIGKETTKCTYVNSSTGKNNNSFVTKSMKLDGLSVPFMIKKDKILVSIEQIASCVKFSEHIKKEGWKHIDACLTKNDVCVNESFDTNTKGKRRLFISIDALLVLLTKFNTGDPAKKKSLKVALLSELQRHVKYHVIEKPKQESFGFAPDLKNNSQVNSQQSEELLLPVKNDSKAMKEHVQKMYKDLHPISPEDMIYVSENLSGTRLIAEMRKQVPGILPSSRQVRNVKHRYLEEFNAILLPRRTATGWYINPARLLDILAFKYPFLKNDLNVRLWGDGRVIGGRHSTFLTLSLLNNDLYLRNVSYQSPEHTYPFTIFYESDSRDNLEMNIQASNFIENFISESKTCSNFYLCGDEMFTIKMLDGSKQLSPTSEFGWNFYHRAGKEQKSEVAKNGLRTDIDVLVDRELPESLIPSIPLTNIVFDTMHGLARIVEKLLSLEIEKILSEGNKNEQVKGNKDTSRQRLDNLISNVNKRGVRQGNFQIRFDNSGKPEQITLNKDHALAIISPTPKGREKDFPHVLTNVVPERLLIQTLPAEIINYIDALHVRTEFDLVCKLWNCIYHMYVILKDDPQPKLLPGKPKGSLLSEDYSWGYSMEI